MTRRLLTSEERQFIDSNRVARLATADRNGEPHAVPICFVVIKGSLYVTIDRKPKDVDVNRLKRLRNIAENPAAAVIVDRYNDDWTELGWVMLRGCAEIIGTGEEHAMAQSALADRYPQYRNM
ncbi:MAG: TIGR03668 family PPOX class F420-dependent oxidoreductase, partial [Hyphomicrobiaceae bacterium]